MGGKDADGKFVADDNNICISCHQGRESTTSVNNALKGKEDNVVDAKISFKNVHYLGAGATLFGADAAGAYQYADKEYLGQNQHPVNKCLGCHDAHALEPKLETCAGCHQTENVDEIRAPGDATDYDGDGNVTEGTEGEITTLSEALFAEIQKYADANSQSILYDTASYPYYFLDANKDGKPDTNDSGAFVAYNGNWTPTLLPYSTHGWAGTTAGQVALTTALADAITNAATYGTDIFVTFHDIVWIQPQMAPWILISVGYLIC